MKEKSPIIAEVLRIDNILEDAYIDYHVSQEWEVLGEYIRIARQRLHERRPVDYGKIAQMPQPPRNHMVNLWIACSLYDHELPDKMSARVRRAMTFLMSKSLESVKCADANKRAGFAVDCWLYLEKEFPASDELLPRTPPPPMPPQGGGGQGQGSGQQQQGEPQQGGGGGGGGSKDEAKDQEKTEGAGGGGASKEEEGKEEKEGEGEGAGEDSEGEDESQGKEEGAGKGEGEDKGEEDGNQPQPQSQGQQPPGSQGGDEQGIKGNLDDFDIRELGEVPKELLDEVMDAISHEIEDLSKSVAQAMGARFGQVNAQTKRGDYDAPAAAQVRRQVESEIAEMARVFDRQKQLKTKRIKGLLAGKLNGRSLARVGTGNLHVYERRQVLDTPNIAVGLLLDVSGSMSHNMPIVWATGCVFAEALIRKQGVNFLALTYTGGNLEVQTTRICDRALGKLCIGNVDQGGGTPSGPAIGSIKVLMDRMPERQKVIIHFTDGSPDDANSVISAVTACRKAGYAVWAIGLRGMETSLSGQYGDGNWETLDDIHELPHKVGELVEKLVNRS